MELLKDAAFVTTICSSPLFVEYQYKSLKHFLTQTFDLYVVDDCDNINETNKIKSICESYNLIYIKCPKHDIDKRKGGDRHMTGLNAGLKRIPEKYTYIGILDGDMFLVKNFDLSKSLSGIDIIAHMSGSGGVTYFWPGIIFWKITVKLHKFHWDGCMGTNGLRTDTGGTTYKFILNNPQLKIKKISSTNVNLSLIKDIPEELNNFVKQDLIDAEKHKTRSWCDAMIINNEFVFFHFRDVSNWQNNNKSYINCKKKKFFECMDKLTLSPSEVI